MKFYLPTLKHLVIQLAKLQIYTLNLTTTFSHYKKNPITFEQECTWWRHQMETFSALLAICARNSPVPGEFPAQRPVTRSFDGRPADLSNMICLLAAVVKFKCCGIFVFECNRSDSTAQKIGCCTHPETLYISPNPHSQCVACWLLWITGNNCNYVYSYMNLCTWRNMSA